MLVLQKVTLANRVLGKNSYISASASSFYSHLPCFSRNAMDNASKNASDMVGSLQIEYDRGRQADIAIKLVDIITGMSLCSLYLIFYSYKSSLGTSAL
jgi:F0F1-type ATP synthase gamma subunit